MNKKCWIAACVILVIGIALAFALPALLPPTPGVTYANYSRIEKGMTRAQVVQLLGEPNKLEGFRRTLHERETGARSMFWHTAEDDTVEVVLDGVGLVELMAWNGISDDRTGLEKLRDRLPWIARKPPPGMLLLEIK